MKKGKVLNDRKQRKSTKFLAVVGGVMLLCVGLYTWNIFCIVSGPLLLLASGLKKYTTLDETGLIINYDLGVNIYREYWPFKEISYLHKESVSEPGYLMLHFTKGAMSKMILMDKLEAEEVIKTALSTNPDIHFDDVH